MALVVYVCLRWWFRLWIQEFHRKFVLAPADKAANNVVVV